MLFAAFVTADVDTIVQSWGWLKRVRFAKWDFVAEEKILPAVKFVILADNHPDILAIETHLVSSKVARARERLSTILP